VTALKKSWCYLSNEMVCVVVWWMVWLWWCFFLSLPWKMWYPIRKSMLSFFFFPDIWFSHLIFYCMIFVLVFFVNFKFLFDFTLNLNVIFSFILSWIHVWSFFFWFWVFILISLARCLISFNFTLNQLMLPPFLFIAFDPHSFILLIVFAFYQKKNFNFIF
jgi:hypothetical protein